jgi:hypothetical protein
METSRVQYGNKNKLSEWIQNRYPKYLSTNAGTLHVAFQNWRRFKEAFAPGLIERAVQETERDLGYAINICADPFGGSGTTPLACQFLGINSSTIELNPFLADLIEAKLSFYHPDILTDAFAQIVNRAPAIEKTIDHDLFPNAPATFVEPGSGGRFLFFQRIALRIAAYREAIREVSCTNAQRFFRVMLASIVVGVSNAVVSGKGRRYRRHWQIRVPDPSAVDFAFSDACLKAMYEIRRYSNRPTFEFKLLLGDARSEIDQIGMHELSVFSPPYPNSFDYTDVYNIELWTLGYLDSAEANRMLRNQTLRSHVQIKRSFSAGPSASLTLGQTIGNLNRVRPRLWDHDIPQMIEAYFDDMRTILRGLRKQMPTGGRIYIVVGDSRYAGIDIRVARILTEEARNLGLEPLTTESFRSMRASPQQGGRRELPENLVTLRSV